MKSEDPLSMDYDMTPRPEPRLEGVVVTDAWWMEPREATPAEISTLLEVNKEHFQPFAKVPVPLAQSFPSNASEAQGLGNPLK